MEQLLSEKALCLFDLLQTIPANLEAANAYLSKNHLSSDEITMVGIYYAQKCFLDFGDHLCEPAPENEMFVEFNMPPVILPELHSAYLYDVIKLLLQLLHRHDSLRHHSQTQSSH